MFKNIVAIAVLTITTVLSGCSGIPRSDQYGPLTSENADNSVDIGSYVQWNEDYAVTAKHIENVKDVVYVSEKYDLKFFKHKSKNPLVWVDAKPNEPLVSKGFPHYPQRRKENVLTAYSVDVQIILYKQPNYALMDTMLVRGMSGGPVLNLNNEVVGINIGYTNEKYKVGNKNQEFSVYLSYKGIQEEWNKFAKQ